MFKSLMPYRLPGFKMSAEALGAALASQSFAPAGDNDLLREGWDAPRSDGLVHVVNGQFLLKLTSEKKHLPSKAINHRLKLRRDEMEKAQGYAPGKLQTKELRERIVDEMLVSAIAVPSSMWVWIDPVNGWLVVDAAGPSRADDAIKLLLKAVDRLPLESLRVQRTPVSVMTEWLQVDDAPAGFTVDMDATLQATGESKASVQWKRHTLDAVELGRHIAAGKQCVRLAMTWDSKISFVLTDSLAVKSLKLLDVLTEKAVTLAEDEKFDSEFALFAGEAAKLLADLVEALGGEATMSDPGEQKAAPAGPAKGDEPVRAQRVVVQINGQDLGAVPAGDGSASDPLYETAVTLVRAQDRASISLVQRHLKIGYNRAARLIETMETMRVVAAMEPNGYRAVLVSVAEASA